MLIGELLDALGILNVVYPFLTPLIQVLQEAVFVYRKGFTFVFYRGHA
jgi:hypothetical protein